MSIQTHSLAVKYRPQNLDSFVGNTQIKETINGFIAQERFPSAILIHGRTGLGKTTLARIIARTLSCTTNNICGTCKSCTTSIERHPDIKEVDAGGDRGIDNIRQLKELSAFAPLLGNQRIIIIDEVHALTSQGASALLKVLEEPSASTMFILCTTDPHKMLATIKGRTKQFEVVTPTYKESTSYLVSICRAEGVPVSKEYEPVFKKIYEMCGGSMRTAVQLLEQVVALMRQGKPVDVSTIVGDNEESNDVDERVVAILCAIVAKDAKTVVKQCIGVDQMKLMTSLRFLVDQLVDNACGKKPFAPVAYSFLSKKVEVGLDLLLRVGIELAKWDMQLKQGMADTSVKYLLGLIAK